jgi:hypothetical protein
MYPLTGLREKRELVVVLERKYWNLTTQTHPKV